MQDILNLDPRYRVGIREIDTQHQRLFEIIDHVNRLLENADRLSLPDALQRAVGDLIDYTRTHFGYEERLMDKAAYPKLAAHKELHTTLLHRVAEMRLRVEIGDESAILDLSRFLAEWLTEHILNADREFGRFAAEHHAGQRRGQS